MKMDVSQQMEGPYLLFLGEALVVEEAKTASGLCQWRTQLSRAQWKLPSCRIDLGLPDMTPAQAAAAGIKTLVVGIVNAGGFIPESWVAALVEALDSGLDVAAGLHQRLGSVPAIAQAAERNGRRLIDLRHPRMSFATGTGRKRSGRRVLTVGTDCAVGKKYTALAIERALLDLGQSADFRATGQTGIMIAGRGVAVDAVVADFIAGAAEWLSPDNDADHWDVIEGQGSLFHPAYAGVSLGLMHGSQPDAIIICHEPGRAMINSVDNYAIPALPFVIETNLAAARLTNPHVVAAGISVNTSRFSAEEAGRVIADIETLTGLPCCDPIRSGAGILAHNLLKSVAQ